MNALLFLIQHIQYRPFPKNSLVKLDNFGIYSASVDFNENSRNSLSKSYSDWPSFADIYEGTVIFPELTVRRERSEVKLRTE